MPSTTELINDILSNVGEIVRGEVQLAKSEIREEAMKAARAGALAGAGAVLAWFGFGFFLLTLMFVLGVVLPLWGSALLLSFLLLAGAATLLLIGRNRFRQVKPKPERTIHQTKEDVEWIRSRT